MSAEHRLPAAPGAQRDEPLLLDQTGQSSRLATRTPWLPMKLRAVIRITVIKVTGAERGCRCSGICAPHWSGRRQFFAGSPVKGEAHVLGDSRAGRGDG